VILYGADVDSVKRFVDFDGNGVNFNKIMGSDTDMQNNQHDAIAFIY